jgi:glucans biosynthesis protein C
MVPWTRPRPGGNDVGQARTRREEDVPSKDLTTGARRAQRISYFDWLRATAVVGVVVYHALQPFGNIGWFISNAEMSPLLGNLLLTLSSFGLPILFVIAGASARFALQKRSPRAFLVDRAQRLLAPFALGAIVFGPINGYTIGVFSGTVSQSFLEYLIAYPGIVIDFQIHNPGLSRLLLVAVHLWFVGALFLFAAAALPIFAFLSSVRGHAVTEALSRVARWSGATLLFAVPATVPIYVWYASTLQPQLWDSWALGWFAVIFVIGYIIYGDDRLVAAVRRDLVPALVIGILGTAGSALFGGAEWASVQQGYSPTYFVRLGLFGLTGWAWTVALLSLAMRVAPWRRSLPAAASQIAMPLYILHVPFVMTISLFVVSSPLDLWAKVLLNVVLGVGVSIVVAAAAARVSLLRPLLGLRPASRTSVRVTRAAAADARA